MTDRYPVIRVGLGKLTPELWGRGMGALELVESNGNALRSLDTANKTRGRSRLTFLAKITGDASLATSRWKYSFTEQKLDGSDAFSDRDNGITGTTGEGYAINILEANNTAGEASPGYQLTNLPSGFELQAVRTGSLVWMHSVRESTGKLRFIFQCENSVDGTCS